MPAKRKKHAAKTASRRNKEPADRRRAAVPPNPREGIAPEQPVEDVKKSHIPPLEEQPL